MGPISKDCGNLRRLQMNLLSASGLAHIDGQFTDLALDQDSIYSNDIYGFLMAYGVEAARSAILKEISGVFDAYKIDVDGRHLELIADYMVKLLGFSYMDHFSRCIVDVRRRIQAFQSQRHLDP
jgi:hypothetical protein